MNIPLLTIASAILVYSHISAAADVRGTSPFESVALDNGKLVIKVSEGPSYIVIHKSGESKKLVGGQTLTIADEEEIGMLGKHLYFGILPIFSPRPGIQVKVQFDGRSFGDVQTTQSYFIRANTAEQGAAANP